nr:hypothetical protein [uncultured bacterium]
MEQVCALNELYLKQLSDQWELLDTKERLLPRNLYLCMPSRAAWDTRFGGGREARGIAEAFSAARGSLTDGLYMAALADTLEHMNIQLYEHYRVLADLLLEGAQKALPAADARVLYAVLKGVRLGLLDPERYLPEVRRAVENLTPDGQDADFLRLARDEYGRTAPR